jgi:hypothetical protein
MRVVGRLKSATAQLRIEQANWARGIVAAERIFTWEMLDVGTNRVRCQPGRVTLSYQGLSLGVLAETPSIELVEAERESAEILQ